MRVKMNLTKKSNRNESRIIDFLSLPLFRVTMNLNTGSSTGEIASLTLDKRDSLERKFLRASSEKISNLQETVSLLNLCIGQENLQLRF